MHYLVSLAGIPTFSQVCFLGAQEGCGNLGSREVTEGEAVNADTNVYFFFFFAGQADVGGNEHAVRRAMDLADILNANRKEGYRKIQETILNLQI